MEEQDSLAEDPSQDAVITEELMEPSLQQDNRINSITSLKNHVNAPSRDVAPMNVALSGTDITCV